VATTAAMTAENLAMTTLSGCIQCVVRLAVTPSRISTQWSTNVSKPWRR
jgi:heterodisulfide reductase subunit C